MEQWREVADYDGVIRVSDHGRVWNAVKNKEIVPYDNGCGYRKFTVRIRGKDCKPYVHRLVAEAFIPNPNGYAEVNHIDSNRSNNNISNLEWVSSSGNTAHAIRKGRLVPWGNAPKAIIAEKDGESIYFETISQAERHFNSRHINCVLNGSRKHVSGWSFRYAEGGDRDVS